MTFKVSLTEFFNDFLKPISGFVAPGDSIVFKIVDGFLYTSAPYKGDQSNVFCGIVKVEHDEDIDLGIIDVHKLVTGVHHLVKNKPENDKIELIVNNGELIYRGFPISFKIQLMNELLIADCEAKILNKDQILDYSTDVKFDIEKDDIVNIKNTIAFGNSNGIWIHSDGETLKFESSNSSGTFHMGDSMTYEVTLKCDPFKFHLPSIILGMLPPKKQLLAFNLDRRVFLAYGGENTAMSIYLSSELKD